MKAGILILTIVVVGGFLTWLIFFRASTQRPSLGKSQASSSTSPTIDPLTWKDYKELLFVDQPLDDLVNKNNFTSAPPDAWQHLFVLALAHVREGQTEEAKRDLKKILAYPEAETRLRLWAWRALRQLGEQPPSNISREVQGVVFEIPINNQWIDTLAAYADGRARYINGSGQPVIVWEYPEEPYFNSLISEVIKSAKPLVEQTPALEEHLPTKQGVIRVSILTYGGIHVAEAKWSDITKEHEMSQVVNAGNQLLLALLKKNEESNQK
jgi:hypothetical protein